MNTLEYKRKEYRVNNIELYLDYNTDNVIISTEVDYIDYMKTFEEEEIKEMHFLFYSDIKYFFEMIQKPPFSITKVNNELEIKFYLDILGHRNIVSINVPEYFEEGVDKKSVIYQRRIYDLEILSISHSNELKQIWQVFLLYNIFYLLSLIYLYKKIFHPEK